MADAVVLLLFLVLSLSLSGSSPTSSSVPACRLHRAQGYVHDPIENTHARTAEKRTLIYLMKRYY